MKKAFVIIPLLLLIAGCSKKFEKLEVFSPEAFAYTLDSGWELNASARVKGFVQNESGGKFSASIKYYADIETPDGGLIEKAASGEINKSSAERMTDLAIEAQIKLEAGSVKGIYKITFFITDKGDGREAKASNFFELN